AVQQQEGWLTGGRAQASRFHKIIIGCRQRLDLQLDQVAFSANGPPARLRVGIGQSPRRNKELSHQLLEQAGNLRRGNRWVHGGRMAGQSVWGWWSEAGVGIRPRSIFTESSCSSELVAMMLTGNRSTAEPSNCETRAPASSAISIP